MKRLVPYILITILTLCFSCKEEENGVSTSETTKSTTYKVAVIAPGTQPQWKRTAEWALENIRKSQRSLSEQVDFKLVWIDEFDNHISNRMKSALSDTAVVAVIGPLSSSKAKTIAGFDVSRKKPLIFPCATSTDLHRMYSNCDYIWNLSRDDVEQIEILLIQALTYGCKRVHVLARDDDYGNTFLSWTSFVAEQYGIEVGHVDAFSTTDDEVELFKSIVAEKRSYMDYVIYAPSTIEDVIALDRYISTLSNYEQNQLPYIFCTDAFTACGASLEANYDFFEGIELSASVESGFLTAYDRHFNVNITSGEAQFYDSFLLLSLALTHMEATGCTLNEAIKAVVTGDDGEMQSWLPADMTGVYASLRQGGLPNIMGVSGEFSFKENINTVEHSTYRHWLLDQHQTKTIEYLSTVSSPHSMGSVDILSWNNMVIRDFYWDPDSVLIYPELNDRWAVLVAGTYGWENYRHQADVYAMYQLLKRHGFADDHILLIAEDDIAYNVKNLYPGKVRVTLDGENVYRNLIFDYNLKDLKPTDLRNILCGEYSGVANQVLPSKANDDVFVFWCGEGTRDALSFGDYIITGEQIVSYFQEMSEKGRYRKLFFALEACFGGSIGEQLEGIPGLLCMTAANECETSKADIQDVELGVWLSNGFTRGFELAIDRNPNITMNDLFFELVANTWGSHVCIYNISRFGSMYDNRMTEFLPD